MGLALGTRSMMTAQDCTAREFRYLLDLAGDLKSARHAGASVRPLDGRQICLLGDSGAARSRWAFEAACAGLGANLTRLDAGSARIGCAESFKDAARVLGRMFDAVEYQGPNRTGAQELARFAGVPVFDGLTTDAHVTQMIADVMTMREHGGRPAHELTYAFVGDTGSDMAQSLMIAGCLCGMDVRMCGPKQLWPGEEFIAMARRLQKQSGARLTITDDPKQAVDRADFVHTSAWLSAGGPKDVWKQRIDLLLKYQVNMDLMKAARNPHVKLLHCLPAHHDTLTTLGAQIAETFGLACGLEVTNDVFESEMNVAFEQAENRVHTIKAMLVATLAA